MYNEVNENEKVIEVVYVSGDKNPDQFNEYYSHMPWLAFPFRDERIKSIIAKFPVKGVPRLYILSAKDGKVIDNNAVGKITEEGPGAIEEYLS